MKRSVLLLTIMIILMACVFMIVGLSSASTIGDIAEGEMHAAMVERGIDTSAAHRIASRYAFISAMMTNGARLNAGSESEELIDSVIESSRALGSSMAASLSAHGAESLDELASVMLLTSRAGIAPTTAAELFVSSVSAGYDLSSSIKILCAAAELDRQMKPDDSGRAIGASVIEMIDQGADADDITKMLAHAWEQEAERRRVDLSRAESERRRLENAGGDDGGLHSYDGGSSMADAGGSSASDVSASDSAAESNDTDTASAGEAAESDGEQSSEPSDTSEEDDAAESDSVEVIE